MSSTSHLTFSSVSAIFRGLQERLRQILTHLPDDIDPTLREDITKSHLKLSTYFVKFDESSYCMWASCKLTLLLLSYIGCLLIYVPVLDPRIAYKGLKEDYKDDRTLLSGLESSKAKLRAHFNEFYRAPRAPSPLTANTSHTTSPGDFDFMARYEIRD